ncbi:LapA family protein [Candidatus Poribacteria bacterium]|nr:LapA family protein [Candidatus Poribacteria bacterium]
MQWKFILTLVILLIFVAFIGQNWKFVELIVFTQTFHVSLAFLILFFILIGFLTGTIIASIKQLKLRKEIKNLKSKIEKQNEELKYLRHLQIKDEE